MTATITRADLVQALGDNPKTIRYFEDQNRQLGEVAATTAENVAATTGLNEATVITLSPNATFDNERILAVGDGLRIDDLGPADQLVLSLMYLIVLNGGFACTFNLEADTNLDFPTSGRVLTDAFLSSGPFADDAAAAAGGVPINGVYRKTGGSVAWRQV